MYRVLRLSVAVSSHHWAFIAADGEPVAVFGVAPVSLISGIGTPWLLGTERVFAFPGVLIREGRRYLQAMRNVYPSLANHVDARNVKSIRWLKHLGFTIGEPEPYGVAGLPFYPFHLEG